MLIKLIAANYAITLVTGQHGQIIVDDFFKCIILKATYLISSFTDACFIWFNWQVVSIGSNDTMIKIT